MSFEQALPYILGPYGVLVVSLIAIIALQREWVVTGRAFRRQVRETEMWRRLALSGTSLAGKAVELAKEQTARQLAQQEAEEL